MSKYSLTIGEASSLMHAERCRFASNRKVQRMCRSGVIDCYKLQTTRNGQPVSEWLVNDTSLQKHIEEYEIKYDEYVADLPTVNGNASLTPTDDGNATTQPQDSKSARTTPYALAAPHGAGDAIGAAENSEIPEDNRAVLATPKENGTAIGETRSLASVLIENATLTAEIEGARQLVAEVRDDREFLREELKEARTGRKDVAAIAERMLETLETIATGGKFIPPPSTNTKAEEGPVVTEHPSITSNHISQPPPTSFQHREIHPSPTGDNQTKKIDQFGI